LESAEDKKVRETVYLVLAPKPQQTICEASEIDHPLASPLTTVD
jgi:hypothetical protein